MSFLQGVKGKLTLTRIKCANRNHQNFSLIKISMDANANIDRRLALYGISVAVDAILFPTVVQVINFTPENEIRLVISFVALIVNVVAALWMFSEMQQAHWKVVISKAIFLFTKILAPYVALSMLKPEWFTWHGFGAICAIVTIVEGYNMLQLMFIWSKQRLVAAKIYVIQVLSVFMWRRHMSTGDA